MSVSYIKKQDFFFRFSCGLTILMAFVLSACASERDEIPGYIGEFDASKLEAGVTLCEEGQETKCTTTLEQANGVLSCYHGTKVCLESGGWSACGGGRITTQIDPTYYQRNGEIRQEAFGQSFQADASTSCYALNPCDPNCQYWAETDEITNDTIPDPDGTPAGPLEDWSITTPVCDHQLCEEGDALPRSCHPCVEAICDSGVADLADCCDGTAAGSWDSTCVDAVYTYCTDDPPPEGPQICAYSIMADKTVDLDFANIIPGAIGGRQGVTFNSAFKGASILISEGNLTLTDSGDYGVVYTKGSVTLRNNSYVEHLMAMGNINTLGSSRIGPNGIFTYGSLQPNHQITVEGPIVARYNCDLGNSNLGRIEATMNCGGNLTTKNNLIFVPGITHYIGGSAVFNGAARHSIDLHLGGGFTINDYQGALLGDLWAGGNVLFKEANNTVNNLQAGGNVSCNKSTQGATGAAVLGGTASGLCGFGSLAQNQSSPPLEAPIPPTIPSFPSPPIAYPSVDSYRRDTSQVCGVAASKPTKAGSSIALEPGIYGNIEPSYAGKVSLKRSGAYVFKNFNSTGGKSSSTKLEFLGSGPWDITVCGKFRRTNASKMIDSSGNQVDGSKVIIYAAAVRNSDCATNSIDRSCCIESNNASHLSGILIAPDCDISIGNGTKSRSTVWANRIFTGSDFKNPPDTDACAASDLMGQISCRTSASGPLIPLYQDGSTYSLGSEVTFGGKRYECLNQSKCDTGGWSNFWPGQGPNWPDAWAQFDDCLEMSIPTTPGVGAPRGECPVLIESSEVLRFKNEPCEDSEDCQINSRCTEADTASSCGGHSKCSSGVALSCAGTDACVAAVCAEEPACCASFWGQTNCADRVEEICAVECGAVTPSLCPHDACVIGEALNDSCSEDVEDVCDSLPGCCSGTGPNEWDQSCVDEFTEVATGIPLSGGVPSAGQSLCDYAIVSGSSNPLYLNKSPTTGDVHSTGNMGGGRITGDASTEGSFSNTTATGSKTAGVPAPPYQEPTWADIVPGGSCPGLPGASVTWPAGWSAGAPGPGNYGTVSSLKSFTFPNGGGDYYVRSLNLKSNHKITMPADGADVNIYVCNAGFIGSVRGTISGGAGQLNVWVKTGNITLNNGGSKWNKTSYTGVFTALNGSVFAKKGTQVYGMLRSINGKVSVASDSFVNASALIGNVGSAKRQSCFDRGIDPNLSAPPVCPLGDSPAQSSTIAESGLCIDNLSDAGILTPRPGGDCTDVDLALDVPCDDKMPVCNRGDTALAAGQAEIVFFPRQTLQFATQSPDTFYQSGSTCTIDEVVPAGECVTITCPAFTEDMTARVQMLSTATQVECNDLDNWSYYPFDRSCGGGSGVVGEEKIVQEVYEATCPQNSTVAWGFLGWNSSLEGAASIDFEARTSAETIFSDPKTFLETASSADSTGDCPYLSSCTVDVGTTLFPAGESNQPQYLELTITLKPDGANLATLEDWDLTYTCIVDQ